ncbi:hypothetical protein ACQ4PT_037387 [Festuca glaucescens]
MLLHRFFDRLTGKKKEASKEGWIHRTTVLVKHVVLDIGDFNASFLNGVHNILGKDDGISFHLVSATGPDPTHSPHSEQDTRSTARFRSVKSRETTSPASACPTLVFLSSLSLSPHAVAAFHRYNQVLLQSAASGSHRAAAMARTKKGWARGLAAFAAVAVAVSAGRKYGWDGEAAVAAFRRGRSALGPWAAPSYVVAHALTLALCPPYAIFFEGAAALVFGFLPGVACVFSAKILGASLSFWIGRAIFKYFTSAMEWLQRNRYFHVVVKGVEKDGWKFVLLARFSPLPSYIINYALSATDVGFFRDFLLPTIVGCLPMILQNVSIVSLAGAAVASTTGSKKAHIYSYLFPILGIVSSILISWRIKQYSSILAIPEELKNPLTDGDAKLTPARSESTSSGETRKRR